MAAWEGAVSPDPPTYWLVLLSVRCLYANPYLVFRRGVTCLLFTIPGRAVSQTGGCIAALCNAFVAEPVHAAALDAGVGPDCGRMSSRLHGRGQGRCAIESFGSKPSVQVRDSTTWECSTLICLALPCLWVVCSLAGCRPSRSAQAIVEILPSDEHHATESDLIQYEAEILQFCLRSNISPNLCVCVLAYCLVAT